MNRTTIAFAFFAFMGLSIWSPSAVEAQTTTTGFVHTLRLDDASPSAPYIFVQLENSSNTVLTGLCTGATNTTYAVYYATTFRTEYRQLLQAALLGRIQVSIVASAVSGECRITRVEVND